MPEMPGVVATPPSTMNPTPPNTGVPGSPASSEQQPKGDIEQAKANVQIAIQVLEHSLPLLGSGGEEGQAVLKALTTLQKVFSGAKSESLAPAELMQMMSTMPDQYKAAMSSEMGGSGAPGGAQPGGM